MTPIVVKEIRLLLPAYVMALLLAILPIWLLARLLAGTTVYDPSSGTWTNAGADAATIFPFFFGTVILALSSLGREFALGTFPLLVTQPLERSRIWWTKITVLAIAMITVMSAWLLSVTFARLTFSRFPFGDSFEFELGRSFAEGVLLIGAAATVLSFSGALWSTLLLRQIIAAFWFTILIPLAILVITRNEKGPIFMWPALAIYSIAGFLWAWRQFLRAQETGWTGGVISFPGWRSAQAASRAAIRSYRPVTALFWKELQLHQIGLVGMACLFVLHLCVVFLRKADVQTFGEIVRTVLEVFGGIWLIVPVIAGSTSVAEERKLDTHQAQLSLPISSRLQFGIKLLFALVLGGLLSPLLLFTAEGISKAIGAHCALPIADPQEMATILLVFLGLSLLSFYASTVARHVMQSLAVAVGAVLAVSLFVAFASSPILFGLRLWHGNLVHYITWPTLVFIFIWLANRNFRSLSFLRRNVLGLTGALLFIVASTSAVYHRAWELIMPLEAAHGPALLVGPKQTKLDSSFGNGFAAVLPDGRLWVDRVAYEPGRLILPFGRTEAAGRSSDFGIRFGGHWLSLSGNSVVPGSNWVDAAESFRETLAIRSDGTLWVSEKPREPWDPEHAKPFVEEPAKLIRFGEETNWQSVARESPLWSVVLLKQDGTMWRLGTNTFNESKQHWPGFDSFIPRRLGKESDWAYILPLTRRYGVYAWKRDGRAWVLHAPDRFHGSEQFGPNQIELEPGTVMERIERLDNAKWKSIAWYGWDEVGLRGDGTLWAWRYQNPATGESVPSKLVQVGQDRDWVGVAGYGSLAALKADGSLWRSNLPDIFQEKSSLATKPPIRLGTHNDWTAVGSLMGGIVSLAADGSLWYWWDWARDYHYPDSTQLLLAASRRPSKIENILGD